MTIRGWKTRFAESQRALLLALASRTHEDEAIALQTLARKRSGELRSLIPDEEALHTPGSTKPTTQALGAERIERLRTALAEAEAAIKRRDLRAARDALTPFEPPYRLPTGKEPEWTITHAEEWIRDITTELSRPACTEEDVSARLGALLDVLDFLSEEHAEPDKQ